MAIHFIGEMIRALVEDGVIVLTTRRGHLSIAANRIATLSLPLPPTLRDAVRERMEHQSSAARKIVGLRYGS